MFATGLLRVLAFYQSIQQLTSSIVRPIPGAASGADRLTMVIQKILQPITQKVAIKSTKRSAVRGSEGNDLDQRARPGANPRVHTTFDGRKGAAWPDYQTGRSTRSDALDPGNSCGAESRRKAADRLGRCALSSELSEKSRADGLQAGGQRLTRNLLPRVRRLSHLPLKIYLFCPEY